MSRHMKTILVKFACFLAVCGVYSQIGLVAPAQWDHVGGEACGE